MIRIPTIPRLSKRTEFHNDTNTRSPGGPTPPKLRNRRSEGGFTMIETLVAIGILGMLFASIVLIVQQIFQNMGYARTRSVALTIAKEKMETIRNLPYDDVGTVGGIPQGPIEQTEVVPLNGLDFTVKTSVLYIDDEFDGIAPADLVNTDYKRARVEVTWGGLYPSVSPMALVTNVVPKGVETIEGGGTLFVQVFNSQALPVSNATVKIDNTAVVPEIHFETLTNANGLVVIPGAPACVDCYRIEITKSGYSSGRTYSTSEIANPLQPDVTIVEGEVTPISFSIDLLSSIILRSHGPGPAYPQVANVIFTLRGSKVLGYDALDEPVYKYEYTTNTGGGLVSIINLEWDTYALDFSGSAHVLAGSSPVLPVILTPASNLTLPIVAVPKTNITLLVLVKNNTDELQASASARLVSVPLSYDQTIPTSATGTPDFGHSFFGSLSPGNYSLTVSLPGYQEASSSLSLTTNQQETVLLNPL